MSRCKMKENWLISKCICGEKSKKANLNIAVLISLSWENEDLLREFKVGFESWKHQNLPWEIETGVKSTFN